MEADEKISLHVFTGNLNTRMMPARQLDNCSSSCPITSSVDVIFPHCHGWDIQVCCISLWDSERHSGSRLRRLKPQRP
ncbi:rCG44048 [Rattus norvegicus]|uniref:RCG44048 n=1 Tax=Rattus norvegicus TaxID=10116 RepID=A6J7M0_RAT|nr:rCG44048 [Rattus norvegicus]